MMKPLSAPDPLITQGNAQVVELVDTQVSGTCGRKVVEVRVFSWAPKYPSADARGGDLRIHDD
jgi:hypothetical protein